MATNNVLQVLLQYVYDEKSARNVQGRIQELNQQLGRMSQNPATDQTARADEAIAIATLRERTKLQLEMLELERRHGVAFQANLDANIDDLALQRQKVALLREQQQLSTRQTQADIVNRPPTFIQFSAFPVAQLFRSLGLNDASNRIMDAGAVLGLVDSMVILQQQLFRLTANIKDSIPFIGRMVTSMQALNPNLGSMGATLISIGAVAIPAIVAIAGVAAVLSEIQKRAEESKKRVEDFANAIAEVAERTAGGATTGDFESDAEKARREAKSLETALGSLGLALQTATTLEEQRQLNIDKSLSTSGPEAEDARQTAMMYEETIDSFFANLSTIVGEPIASTEELSAAIDALKKSLGEAEGAAIAASAAARTPEARANQFAEDLSASFERAGEDAAVFGERLGNLFTDTYGQVQARAALENASLEGELQAREALATQTGAQIAQMREQAERDLEAIIRKMETATAKDAERYQAEVARIVTLLRLLDGVTLTNVDFENAKKEVEEYRTQIAELTADFQRQARQLAEERAISARREAEDFGRSRERTLEAEARAMAREDRDRARRQEREQKEAARRFEDFLKRIRQIIEDFALRMSEAVAERDALAFVRAKRERDKQLKEEDENYKEAEKRREEDLKDEQDYFEESRRERIEDFQRRLREEDDDRALRLRRQVEDYQRRDLIEQQNFNQRRAQLMAQYFQENAILQAMSNSSTFYVNYIASTYIAGLQSMAQYTAGLFSGIGGGTTTPDHGSPWAGWGAMTARGSGSMTINVAGAQQRTIEATSRQVALSTFDRVLTDMGL